jgi:hypothetical protein
MRETTTWSGVLDEGKATDAARRALIASAAGGAHRGWSLLPSTPKDPRMVLAGAGIRGMWVKTRVGLLSERRTDVLEIAESQLKKGENSGAQENLQIVRVRDGNRERIF